MQNKRGISVVFLWILVAVMILVFLLFSLSFFDKEGTEIKENLCGDGTFYGNCSEDKPFYCDNGNLIEEANICGCPDFLSMNGHSCSSDLETGKKEIELKYFLKDQEEKINLSVYSGVVGYLNERDREIFVPQGENFTRSYFRLYNLEDKFHRYYLLQLAKKIENFADNDLDRLRIAVSLVQNMDYLERDSELLGAQGERYAYEVLYEGQGVCGEKSELLAFLLREFGYGVAIFYFPYQTHESVGVKCPMEYSFNKTGFCFVETSENAIISDWGFTYLGVGKLDSNFEMSIFSEGKSLPENMKEYKDAKDARAIREGKKFMFVDSTKEKLIEEYNLPNYYFA
jgi:hypothetical protein